MNKVFSTETSEPAPINTDSRGRHQLPDDSRTLSEPVEKYQRFLAFTLELCKPLEAEEYSVQSMTEAIPILHPTPAAFNRCGPSQMFGDVWEWTRSSYSEYPGHSPTAEPVPYSPVIEERNRLAREIHDTLVQEFAGILLHLEAANGLELGANASECLARAMELAKSGLEDTRRIILGLRPKSLEDADLPHALRQLAERFSRDCGIRCTFRSSGRPQELPEEIENELYRVAQEALCNVRKHSRAGYVSMLLSHTSAGVVLAIKDNGRGFAVKRPEPGAHGFGLPAMCERASRLGGRMDINSEQGTGTEVRMSVPLCGRASKERKNR